MRKAIIVLAALFSMLLAYGSFCEEEPLYDRVQLIAEGEFPSSFSAVRKSVSVTQTEFNAYIMPLLKNYAYDKTDVTDLNLDADVFYGMYQNMLNHHPELFYVTGGYWRLEDDIGNITHFYPVYRYEIEDNDGKEYNNQADIDVINQKRIIYNANVQAAVRYASSASTDIGRILRVSDHFCRTYEYDMNYENSYPINLFESKTGVCNAYCLAYLAVMNELGIECTYTSSEAMNHIWNLVKLDGYWYHVDVTWNDPISDMPLRACHSNLLLSDQGIAEAGHYNWVSDIKATSTKYDSFFWKNIEQVIPMLGDTAYYCPTSDTMARSIQYYNFKTGESGAVYDYTFEAYIPYYSSINPVWATNKRLYYAMCGNMYSVLHDGTDRRLEYQEETGTKHIFYIAPSGDSLSLYVAESYSDNGSIVNIPLDISREITLDSAVLDMEINSSHTLSCTVTPTPDNISITYASSNESVAKVDENGQVTATGVGACTITAECTGASPAACTIIVRSSQSLTLPKNTTIISGEAFSASSPEEVILPEGLIKIESGAFSDCKHLLIIWMPEGDISIADDAFEGADLVTLLVYEGSVTHEKAQLLSLPYAVIPEGYR